MAGFLPDSFIQRVLDETDIVSLIDSYIPLQKKGKDHWSLCPFCEDGNNPSFSVSSQKQFYYCFRCRASGNAIGFLMNYQSKDFLDAIETLATNAGLEIPQKIQGESFEKYKKIIDANEHARDFFLRQLRDNPEGKQVLDYLLNRGISEEVLKEFEIGFAPSGWANLKDYFLKLEKHDFIKNETGLFKKNEKNNVYDVFRNRIIFPIKSKKGHVIGFGGRVIDKEMPKYLNSSENEVFKKGKELYGFHEVLKNNRNLKKILVVEGYTDVLSLFSNKISYAVATLGIATSKIHLEKLFGCVDEVVFCFDGDEAGMKAAESAMKISLPTIKDGKILKFLFLPDAHDPSSLLEDEGRDEFEERLDKAMVLSDYIFNLILNKHGNSIEEKAAASKEFMSLISPMPPSNYKNILMQEFSKKVDIKLEAENKKNPERKKIQKAEEKEISFELDKVTKSIIKTLIERPELSHLEEVDYLVNLNDEFISNFINFLRSKEGLTFPMILHAFEEQKSFLIGLIEDKNLISSDAAEEYIIQAVNFLKKNDKTNFQDKLKSKYFEGSLTEKEKIELKKIFLENFENLNETEINILKEI
tara:strand:- start:1106 stop:2863 length:1758 start_codon:yes stop_codon:yes gene_type:complete